MEINIELPLFTGYYNTVFDVFENLQIVETEDELDSYGDLTRDQYAEIDFKEAYQKLTKGVVNNAPYLKFLNDNGFKIDTSSFRLYSPSSYNFVNDSIRVDVDFNKNNFQVLLDFLDVMAVDFYEYVETKYNTATANEMDNLIDKFDEAYEDSKFITIALEYLIIEQFNDEETVINQWISNLDAHEFIY